MLAETRHWTPDETGGMLLGYRAIESDSAVWVITGLIDAGPGAARDRHRFVPDGPWQQGELEAAYERSGRVNTYLGDWHSHPRGRGSPSAVDRSTYGRVASEPESGTDLPLVLIVAPRSRPRVAAFAVDGDGASTLLEIVLRGPYEIPTADAPASA